MRVLAFDTATSATTVAVADAPETVLCEFRDDPEPGSRPGHARHLLGLIARCVEEAGGWESIDRLAVGLGPGTFTGLRIGVSTAVGLVKARGCEIVGVDTLRSLALGARRTVADGHPVIALIDARRGELFAAAWRADSDPACEKPLIEPVPAAPARVEEMLALLGDRPVAVGDGAILCREMLFSAGAIVPSAVDVHRVSAAVHCLLGSAQPAAELATVRPHYLRVPDAELARRRAR